MGREGGLSGKKQGSNMPECFSKSSRSKTKDLVESFRMKTTTTTVTRSMLMSRNVKKFDTLSFNSAFYQSAIASRRNEEIESYRRWMLIKSTFQYFLSSSFYFSSFFFESPVYFRRFCFLLRIRVSVILCRKMIFNQMSNIFLSSQRLVWSLIER